MIKCIYCAKASEPEYKKGEAFLCIVCLHCHRQMPATSIGGLRILSVNEIPSCEDYYCEFAEPYGFVPECGCPVHDRFRE